MKPSEFWNDGRTADMAEQETRRFARQLAVLR